MGGTIYRPLGLGANGSSALYHLSKAGKKVAGIDRLNYFHDNHFLHKLLNVTSIQLYCTAGKACILFNPAADVGRKNNHRSTEIYFRTTRNGLALYDYPVCR